MSRELTAGMQTEIARQLTRPAIFYEGEFATGTVRLWSGVGSIAWNGQTWLGAGQLAGVSLIEENADVRAVGVKVSLSGVSATLVSLALAEARQGKRASLWLAMLDEAGAVLADPYLVFNGLLDVPTITETGDGATIELSYENRLISLRTPNIRRYTDEDQKVNYPDDTGFAFVAGLQDVAINW